MTRPKKAKSPAAAGRGNERVNEEKDRSGVRRETEKVVIPVVEEQLRVGKRKVETGKVRITKRQVVREEVLDEPLMKEEVEVERVTINRPVNEPVSVRYEGSTMIVPVLEEVLFVEKRLILREELRVTMRQDMVREPQRVSLRSEEVKLERKNAKGEPAGIRKSARR